MIGRAEEPESWDRHRGAAIDALIARLGRDPQRLLRALERTRQGTEWAILQWERLGEVLRDNRDVIWGDLECPALQHYLGEGFHLDGPA